MSDVEEELKSQCIIYIKVRGEGGGEEGNPVMLNLSTITDEGELSSGEDQEVKVIAKT